MELRCQLERHAAALYADRAPVITNRRADASPSFHIHIHVEILVEIWKIHFGVIILGEQ